MREQTRTF